MPQSKPLISIVIPVYKVEHCLPVCLNSLLAQTYENIEIICVDDGSPDKCPQILDSYAEKDSRIRVIHQENGGVSRARNRGIEAATGEYVALIDSDDWVDTRYVEILMKGVQDFNADVSACNYQIVHEAGVTTQNPLGEVRFQKVSPEMLLKHWSLRRTVWARIYKRTLLENHKFISEVKLSDDTLFNLDVICHVDNLTLVYVDLPLYYYYMKEDSATHTISLTKNLGLTNWYADHPDREEHTGYEWVMRMTAVKLGLSSRYFAGFDKEDKKTVKEANASLRRIIPDMLKSRYTPATMKMSHFAMYAVPGLYRVWRSIEDPTMLQQEKERIFAAFRKKK